MSQYDYGTIDPNAKSGTQLAVDLNNWRDALHSGHRGAERPGYAQGGMLWIRETSAEQWDLMFYDGDTDFVLRSVNPTTNQLIGIPQSAVSGLSEIATTTAELEGKAADLEIKAGELETKTGELEIKTGELETKTGELEIGFANLAGRTSDLESMPGLGWGQTWQNVTGSRALNTTFTNTTGRSIEVSIWVEIQNGYVDFQIDGIVQAKLGGNQQGSYFFNRTILNGQTYRVANGSISRWEELR